jgi:hypothetical protein
MRRWLAGEPSLDELLGDDIMGPVVASAGLSREQFRSHLAEVARRLAAIGEGRSGQGRDNAARAVCC